MTMPVLTWCRPNQPSLVSKTYWMFERGGHDGVGVVHFQMMDFLNHAVRVNVGGGNGFGAVLHPERDLKRLRKNENHGVGVLDVRAEHHAGLLLARGERLLGVQRFRAEIKLHRRQFGLRLCGQRHFAGRWRGGILRIFAASQQRDGKQQRE